ncbi:MAG: Gfo/Idh/MocA family oxidoreductase [Chloroflexi bacterium]|nr:Gfo/Idh/MocA family oxidoreductase [Chloroflexota bacterium]MBV9547633.1 Gfo/Idh/MocA family oxidoreductase [Chloroflexota bacterium]
MPQNPPTLKVAILGAGMIGRAHARAFRALRGTFQPAPAVVDLVAIADADLALARDAQTRWEIERVASSWQEVAEMQDVDIVCVALPNHQHREPVEALVGDGKHVLCEKPLASTSTDARAMLDLAQRNGVVHGVGFNLRRAPAIASIHAAITEGRLGDLQHFSGQYFTDYGASPDVPFTWRYERSLAGSGALGDIGSHVIDMARHLVGELGVVQGASLATFIKERPVPAGHVTGHSVGATTGEFRAVDTDDVAAFTCAFENGALGDFRFSRVATGYRNSPAFDLIGSRGAINFDMERAAEFNIFETSAGDKLAGFRRVVTGPQHPYFNEVVAFPVAGVGYGYSETYVGQAYEFVRAVAEQRPYSPNFEDGVAVVEICEAVQRAATAVV